MEIVLTVFLTLVGVLTIAGFYLLIQTVGIIKQSHQAFQDMGNFMNQMAESINDAQMCIDSKKRAMGLDREEENESQLY